MLFKNEIARVTGNFQILALLKIRIELKFLFTLKRKEKKAYFIKSNKFQSLREVFDIFILKITPNTGTEFF